MIELLYILHPDDCIHAGLVAFSDSLPATEQAEHAQLFRLGNVAMQYFQISQPTEDDYQHWLKNLSGDSREAMNQIWYLRCRSSLIL